MAEGTRDFRLSYDARKYFEKINKNSTSGKFKIMLQQYWLCAQIGILYNEKGTPPDKKPLTDKFAFPLKEHQHLIRAFAYWRHAESKNIDPKNEDDVMPSLSMFFDQEALTKLGKLGMSTLDKYAAGGFSIIRKEIPNETDLARFLLEYLILIKNAPDN
jgi:hypothetical protein